jgi:integrase/recombinase XerD
MRKYNPDNELAKREYRDFLRNAGGRSEATLDMVAAAIHRFEAFNRYCSFKSFQRKQAISFKDHLAQQKNEATGRPLSKATLYSTLKSLRAFFEWLAREPGYRKALVYSDAQYFNVTENDARVATASRTRPAPTLDQVRRMVEAMPTATPLERRDRALVATVMLTGARAAAVASLRLKHLDLTRRSLFQDAREVRTKRAKTFTTFFYPVGEPFEDVVRAWAQELTQEHDFGPDDPLFPATRTTVGADGQFDAQGFERRRLSSSGPVRDAFKRACAAAGLPYYNPHSLRQTLVRLGYDLNLTGLELKAWSQGFGHNSPLTTLVSYGALSEHEQATVMAGLAQRATASPDVQAALATLQAALGRQT